MKMRIVVKDAFRRVNWYDESVETGYDGYKNDGKEKRELQP